MTPDMLLRAMPSAGLTRATQYAAPLSAAMAEFGIDTGREKSAFLAQVCHESGSLRYVLELASGDAYEGRKDLGNTQPGDGRRFKGRGLIQITGRANYEKCGKALGIDLIANPAALERDTEACRSAAWFWSQAGLNLLAEQDKFGAITKAINGGYNGLDDRLFHWLRARKVFGV